MKNFLFWLSAIIITLSASVYQRMTGPTYPQRTTVQVNGKEYPLKLVRSLGLDEEPLVRLKVSDTSATARLYFRRFPSNDKFQTSCFSFKSKPVHSFIMNKIFNIQKDEGFFAEVQQQPEAGKIEYYFEITDQTGTKTYMKDSPVIIRFKGSVPNYILIPHILIMFIAMLLSSLAGLYAISRNPKQKKYGILTFVFLITGGMILGPLVQMYAFGELWTGIPFGWDLTDNKTLIAVGVWLIAVLLNRKNERPLWTLAASIVLLLVYSIPHSLLGSQLNYASGEVTQGFITFFLHLL